jgi:hypothetical protein
MVSGSTERFSVLMVLLACENTEGKQKYGSHEMVCLCRWLAWHLGWNRNGFVPISSDDLSTGYYYSKLIVKPYHFSLSNHFKHSSGSSKSPHHIQNVRKETAEELFLTFNALYLHQEGAFVIDQCISTHIGPIIAFRTKVKVETKYSDTHQ